MEDWHDMLPTQKYAPPYRIQWSPTGDVRAKHDEDPGWMRAKCSKAVYAITTGYRLLDEVRLCNARRVVRQ